MSLPDYYNTSLKDTRFGSIKRFLASFTMAAQGGAFTAGDLIGNSNTGSAVTPLTFENAALWTPSTADADKKADGRILGAAVTLVSSSGTNVITACDFDLLIFRSAPFAAGGYPATNAALTLTKAIYNELVCVIPFVNGAWRNQLGALTAGAIGWQRAVPSSLAPAPFSLAGLSSPHLYGLLQAKAAWDPSSGSPTYTVDVQLDVDQY